MSKRMFRNSIELEDGRTLSYSCVYDYQPASFHYPEDWQDYEPSFEIDGEPASRQDFLDALSAEEFAQLVDDAQEDRDWSPEVFDPTDCL